MANTSVAFDMNNTSDSDGVSDILPDTVIHNTSVLDSDNEDIMEHSDMFNENTNVIQGESVDSPGDELNSPSVCLPVNCEKNTSLPCFIADCQPEPTDEIETNTNIKKLRKYIQTQRYGGSKWDHSLFFEATMDKINFSNMDIIQYVGNSSYKDRKDQQSFRIYFNPETYSVEEELAILSSTPEGASIQIQTQQRFKSSAYMTLYKDMRVACGHCGFNFL